MAGWGEFAGALALFLLSHALPARPAMRARIIAAVGTRRYLGLYSILSVALLAWLIVAAGRAPYLALWPHAPWQNWVPALVMPLVCLLVAFGAGARNPFSFGGRAEGFDPARPGVAGAARHPLLLGLALWAGAHMVPNGDLAHVTMFAIFAGFAILGMKMIDRRRRRQWGAQEWERMARATSLLPLAALLSGRWRPRALPDPWRLAAAATLYAVLVGLHRPVLGVSPWPIW